MIITNRFKKCVIENIKGSDNQIYYRVWRSGEFEVNEVPTTEDNGSILLSVDTLLRVTDEVESNCPNEISQNDDTQTLGYIILDGYEITHFGTFETYL